MLKGNEKSVACIQTVVDAYPWFSLAKIVEHTDRSCVIKINHR